ncbi:hypothetical protein AIOL_000607 [Candidatus Rhodobacter oscarellae]|uniref:Hedgehog/Intein (Hint) domain-containing protein n=1 Tax=Candidatus Rhodobacter oscarellae TaxID=1675527 RepID=A0A0J9ECE9_9RHOB|nr:Hint domain-containing protein [Candidatus Rhodobacter lobularis]KMW60452.1 hypothetical protein AIOL_000607 [Candidatus Rhodobacter lobularis]
MMHPQSQFEMSNATAVAALGLARGTEVMTLDGIRRVETLHEGDRIVTRTGARTLRGVSRRAADSFCLDFDKPQVVFLAEGQVYSDSGLPFAA